MPSIKNMFSGLTPKTRRTFLTIGFITLGFVVFSLATIRDLLAPKGINEIIVNPIPIVISIVGCVATVLAWKAKIRIASYLLIVVAFISFPLISYFSVQPVYSNIAELMIVLIPLVVAIHSLSEKEFIWIAILALLARSLIQILGTYKLGIPVSEVSARTESIAEWVALAVALLFLGYIAFNLNNLPFKVKMILVLGILTIIPIAVLESISNRNLETSLTHEANQGLVLSSERLASAVDSYIQTTSDATRNEAYNPLFTIYFDQLKSLANSGGQLLPQEINVKQPAMDTLLSLLSNDPVNILSCELIDDAGIIQLSTDQNEIGESVSGQEYYLAPIIDELPYVSPVIISDNGTGIIHFSAPVRSPTGSISGVFDITYSASMLQQTIVRNSEELDIDTSAMLLDENNIILAHSSAPNLVYKIVDPANTNSVLELISQSRLQNVQPEQLTVQMEGLVDGLKNLSEVQYFSGNFDLQRSQNPVPDRASATKLHSRDWYVVAFTPLSTLVAPIQKQERNIAIVSVIINLVSIMAALGLTHVLVSPILSLTHTSKLIAQGELNAVATVSTQDEIGTLATTFNSMTERMRDLIDGLEQRVAERTKALEHRAIHLQAAADVGNSVARLRDLNDLMRQVSHLISQRFGFYHVGIFLLDERGEYAVLRASNSNGGQHMLIREHKLKVGEVGIVGDVTSTGQARIALNVGDDIKFFRNPDLPLTRSEMAFPLIAGGNILGALDIQSTQESAFTDEDIMTLKVLADQIAIAIENARLFSEYQTALEAAQRAYREISKKGWEHTLQKRQAKTGYISLADGQVLPVSGNPDSKFAQSIRSGKATLSNNDFTLYLPIMIRGQNIGAIRLEKHHDSSGWKPEEITMANTLIEQLGAALESARLYDEASQRADRERLISEIATNMRNTTDPETMLQVALNGLKEALGAADIQIHPYSSELKGKKSERK